MAARNPLLDAINGGGGGNPLLDAISASEAVTSLTGKTPTTVPSLSDTITDPNLPSQVVARAKSEAQRLPGERGMGDTRPPEADAASVLRGLGISTVEAWRQAGLGIKRQAQDLLGPGIDAWIERNMPGAMTQDERRAAFGGTDAEIASRRSQARVDDSAPQFESDFWEAVYGGAQSTLQTAPGIAAGIIGGPAAGLGILGAQTEAQSYNKYRDRGATGLEALAGAAGEGATEVATELLPMGFLVNKLGKAGAGEFITGLLARELPTEQVATFVQDAIDTAIANPDKSWEDFWSERPDAAYKTAIATVVQSGAYGAIGAAARAAGKDRTKAEVPGNVNAAAVDALNPNNAANDGKAPVPLSREDVASPIGNDIIQTGKNALADALAAAGSEPPRPPALPKAAPSKSVQPAADTFSRMVQITLGSESRNRDYDGKGNVLTSPAGAKGKMQVMDGTNLDPGFGVRPAADNSLAERARVGRDYLAAMLRRYKGDPAKMWAAYNWGPGALDDALAEYGAGWLDHAPAETRAYVMKNLSQLGQAGFNKETGEVATIAAPEQAEIETESPIDFAARVLGKDFLNGTPAVPEVPSAPVETPSVASPGATSQPDAAVAPEPVQATSQAPADVRGEPINDEWSRFSDTSGTLNLSRADMPQIDAAHRGAFANFLKGQGIGSTELSVPAASLKPTQAEYSESRVQSAKEREGGNRAILISNDGYIVDGHHQWMAARDNGEDVRAIQLDAPIYQIIRAGHDFPSSTIDEEAAKEIQTRAKRDRSQNTETDFLMFLAANGGISDTEEAGHSLRAQRNLQRFIPGFGSLIRPSGMSPDRARERAVEAGWLPEDASEADFLELLERASFNPVYHPTSDRSLRESMREEENLSRQQDALDFVRAEAERLGLEGLDETDLERAAALTFDGYSETDALYATVERKLIEDFNTYPATLGEEYHVPFDAEGAPGWEAIKDPFPESARGGAGEEGGERSAPDAGATRASEDAAPQSGEAESRASVEDTPSGKGVIVRGASEAELEAIKAALPEKASGMVGRDGGVTYSKKHEDAIRAVLQDSAKTPTSESVKPETAGTGSGQATPVASDARQESEQLSAAEAPATGTAPEHAHVGVDDRELAEIVVEFDEAAATDNGVTNIFAPPAKGEIVRLNKRAGISQKGSVFSSEHGWMTPAEARAKIEEWKAHAQAQGNGNANADKVVLSLFDLSGKWSQPWEEAGYQVYRFDIQADPEVGDVHNFSSEFFSDWFGDFEGADIYAILAACPCTDFASSGARHFAAKDADGRTVASVKLVHQTLATIEHFKPAIWAIENPVGRIEDLGGLPPWRLSFDPFVVGETYTKKTLIWGRFNGELPTAPVEPVEGSKMHSQFGGKSMATKNARSATPEGFAYSFFMANNAVDHPAMAIANKFDRLDRGLIERAVAAGVSEQQINEAVEDLYYQELDDDAANAAIAALIAPVTPPEGRTADAAKTPAASAPTKPKKAGQNPHVSNGERYTVSERVDYLSAGETYVIESAGKKGAYFRNAETGAGTHLQNYQIRKALADGVMQPAEGVTNPVTPARAAGYGTANKIISADRAQQARERLRAKLDGNTLNSGVDPELLAEGVVLAAFHIEAGARKFADFAKAVADDLGRSMADLKPYLRAWYNGARDMLEDSGAEIDGMDGPGAVKAALTMIEDTGGALPAEGAATVPPQAPAAEQGTATAGQPGRIEQAFMDAFAAGRAFASITEARAYAAEVTGVRIDAGSELAKALDEQIESAVVRVARNIAVQNEGNPIAAYQRLVRLYDQQPRLGVRTSTSVEQQAYSTPVPLAYLASRLAGISQDTTVYEPSAGNGALLIDARPTYVTANELNPDRVKQLRAFLPGATVTESDAAEARPADQFDAIIANPPFGPVKDDTGATVRFQVDSQYSTNEIDHAIAMKALEAMKDGGRAVLIVGGINKTITDPKKRADAYNAKAKREFYFKLYSQYNVTDHFTVDGSLYAKQGAGWPVDVIVIEGRGKSSRRLPAVSAPRQYAGWDALQEVLSNGRNTEAPVAVRGQDGSNIGEGSRAVSTDVGNSGSERAGGNNGRAGRDTAQQPQPVRAGLDNGQSSGVRVDAERAGVDQAAVDQQPGAIAGRDPVRPEVEENERQVAYQPGSRSNGMGTLVPVNMQTAISDALAALAQRRGDIDSYVADRLGYSAAELSESFGAEQVDAIALAIDNIERGAGFIIGDQTGIGKGRVNAAIIRYAIRSGRNPIFVTEKPNLYADMFRDMEDIGLPKMLGRDINAVMTNSGLTVPLGDKRTLKSGSDAKKHDAMLRDLSLKGLKAAGVDVLMTTYSQMQTVRGQATVRQEVIRALANGGVVMFDESHNAGGQQNVFKEAGAAPNRAEFARELVQGADGVFYSSATYAKRPDVMDLYAATDMKLAVEDLEALGEAIAKGGVPMQQVVAAMLARSGQYVRRERSFDGIAYNTPTIDVSREQYNNVASVLAAIQDFSEGYVADAVARVDEELRDSAENVAPDGSIGGAGASSTNFTAIMHNVVDQMLLAFAADAAADRAIDSIRNGEKPVLTLASTLETFIEDYANEVGAQEGDRIDITFADIFRRYLERTRRYTVKKPFAEKGEKGERRRLTDEQLGPDGVRAFKEAQRLIDEAGIHTLPGSPIDHIIARVEKAGYAVSEITGRTMGIDYSGNETRLKKRGQGERSIKGRLATINGFNDGKIDAVILNKSGSTGLSLHASEKFKDQRKRRMILVQAEGNIDTHMQMLGRVHRTGQVVLPEYDQLVVGVPAARRPAAVLAKKMASLNANTTASRDSALTSSEVLDFMNVYGDEIAARMMEDEPEIHMRLGEPLADTDKGGLNREEAARKVTGRIPLLPIELQEELYERLEDEYRALIAQKDAAGENALEAKTFDFDAETVDRVEAQPPVPGSSSPFADGVYVERIRVKRTGKPIPAAEVTEMVADALELDMPTGRPSEALAALQQQAEAIDRTRLTETLRDAAAFAEKAIASVKDEGKKKEERDKLAANYKAFQAIRKAARVGDTVRIKTDNGNVYGVITDVYRRGKAKNPIALGVWKARVALVDAAREMTIAFSQLNVPGEQAIEGRVTIEKADSIGLFKIIDAFDEMQVDSREERSVVTGNLLAGFDYVNGKGAIINYTASGGQVRQGILLPREFNLEKHQKAAAIRLSTAEMVDAYLREGDGSILGQGKTGQVSLQAIRRGNTLLVTAAKAKSSGGEFFLNRDLTRITGDFVSKSGGMVAESGMERVPEVADVLLKAGVKFEVPAGADDKAKELGRKIVERFRPAPPPPPAPVETQSNETVATERSFVDVEQPQRTMTQSQRGELEARQQQSMARRGGQDSIRDQPGGLFSAERDQDALFSRTDDAEAALAEWGEIVPRLNDAVRRLGLVDKVNVLAVDRIINDPTIAGQYRAGVIQIALATAQDPEYTLDHEAIHALRDLGLFKPSEWTALVNGAKRDKKLMETVSRRYSDLSEERQAEEAVADMFAQWRAGQRSQSGFIRAAFQRALDFFAAIRKAVRGAKLEDQVKDIMRRIAQGDVGGRDPDGPGGGGTRDSRIGDAAEKLMQSGTVEAIRDGVDVWRTKLQDRFLPLLRAQQRVEMQSGKPLAESANAYLAEELMTGRVGARLERLADELVNPLFDRMKGLGLTVDELETYLYARHAVERNARISSINSEFAEGTGSGMTDAEAAGILAAAEAEGKLPALERAAELVDDILKFAVDTRVEAGLLSQEEADAWRDTYQFYVPLRGRGELIPEVDADRPMFGSGINIRGKESKRAFGRKSKAANILAYSIMQAEEAIARAGRNEVAQAFYQMVRENPDESMWSISRVTRKPVWNAGTGTVAYRNDSTIQPEDRDYTVSLKINGQERRVTLNRDNRAARRLAAAMRNLDAVGMSGPLRIMSQVNRYLSRVNTGWNPEFIISNAFRDIQTATINLAGFDAPGLISGTLRDYKAALGASFRANVKGDEGGDWGRWYREFVDEGGRVYFNHVEDVNEVAARINRQFKTAANGADAAKMRAVAVGRSLFEAIDNANTGLENAVRLSAYKNAREAGMSKAQAASLAKNLTVNFNRRGDWGVAMNAMYLFYNASIQGSARILQAAFTPGNGGKRVRRILFGIAASGFALEMLNAMLAGDDDDGESFYDKIAPFEKDRNMILMIPGAANGRYIKIPMPYGYNVFHTIGRNLASIARGRPWTEAASGIAGSIVDAFNPVGGTSSVLNLIAPTIVDPVVDLYRNRDFADRPIYREQQPYGPEEPNSQMYWGSVNPIWKGITTQINKMTGGDEVLPGAIDINPEVMEYLTGVVTGAAGSFLVDRIGGNVVKAATGQWDAFELNDAPMARKLLGAKPGWYDKAAYYTRVEQIEQIASRPKEYAERGMIDKAEAYAAEHEKAIALMPDVKAAKKAMKRIRSDRADIEAALNAGDMTDSEAREARKQIKDAEEEVVANFNRAYLQAIDVPARP